MSKSKKQIADEAAAERNRWTDKDISKYLDSLGYEGYCENIGKAKDDISEMRCKWFSDWYDRYPPRYGYPVRYYKMGYEVRKQLENFDLYYESTRVQGLSEEETLKKIKDKTEKEERDGCLFEIALVGGVFLFTFLAFSLKACVEAM